MEKWLGKVTNQVLIKNTPKMHFSKALNPKTTVELLTDQQYCSCTGKPPAGFLQLMDNIMQSNATAMLLINTKPVKHKV